jgi:hypothetical protein
MPVFVLAQPWGDMNFGPVVKFLGITVKKAVRKLFDTYLLVDSCLDDSDAKGRN